MSKAAEALTRALSKNLQAIVRAHIDAAEPLLEPAELLAMPIIATVEALGGAIGSVAASIANASGGDERTVRDLVAARGNEATALLFDNTDSIVAKAMEAIVAAKADAA